MNTKFSLVPNTVWLACCLSICMFLAYGQARAQLSIINSPAGYDAMFVGYEDFPIVVDGILYMRYQRNGGNFHLAKYDGTTLTIIPNPAGYENPNAGYYGSPVVVGNALYMVYKGNDGNYDLAKYDGTTLTIIPSPAGYENNDKGYIGNPVVVGSTLYMRYQGNDSNNDLAQYDGTTLTIIPSPTGYENSGRGYYEDPIVMGSTLYMRYWDNDGNYDLAKYDGTTLTIIPSPTGYENTFKGYSGNPVVVGSTLYMRYWGNDDNNDLAKYDGTTLTIIPSPTGYENSGMGYNGNPILVGSTLYMSYQGNDNNHDLAKYDGTALTIIPSPIGYQISNGYTGSPIVIGSTLYMQYRGNDGNYDLAKYDGTTLTIIPSPAGYENNNFGYDGISTIIGSTLYIYYLGNNYNYDLAKYDGTTLTIIPSPTGYENSGGGYEGNPILVDGNLYMRYRSNSASLNLAKYNGTTLTMIPNPAGFENSGYIGNPVAIGSILYLRYRDNGGNFDLARYTDPSPEINLQGNNINITNNDLTPNSTDHTDFGTLAIGGSLVRTFTIQNTGGADVLTINSINNTNTTDFTVGGLSLPTTVPAGGSKTFTITMNSATVGTKNATITIQNNDANESAYNFAIRGESSSSPQRGNMLNFNGTNQGAFANATFPMADVTIEGWVKVDSYPSSGYACIFSNGSAGFNGYGLYIDTAGNLFVLFGGVAFNYPAYSLVMPTNTWVHIALVGTGTNTWNLYLDGKSAYSFSGTPATASNFFSMGAGYNGSALVDFTHSSMDEVRVWNVARTQAQIREKMHLTLSGTESGLIAYYQFNETTSNALEAIAGNHATLQGSPNRVASTVSVGKGVSKLVSVMSVGAGAEISLDNTQMEIDFNISSANPNEEILVTQITAETPLENTTMPTRTTSCYWVIRNFGTNTGLVFDNMRFRIPNHNTITNDDETSPANLKLYHRTTNIGTNSWTQIASANSASNTTKEINFPAPINTSFSEFIIGSTSSPLPITLLGLKGKRVEGLRGEMTEEIKLEWTTAQEINNKGFEVEMSENGLAYQKIAFVEGRGNSTTIQSYNHTTIQPNDAYYRLKQVDFDGKFSYSPVVFVEGVVGKIAVYPNPNNGTFTISVGKDKLDSPARLLNAVGKEVWRGKQTEVRTTNLPTGMYFLHTTVAGKSNITKVVIER